MRGKVFSMLMVLTAATAFADEPEVVVTDQSYDAAASTLTVTYSLTADSPMIVTFDILDGEGRVLPAEKTRRVSGDVNCLVTPGMGRSFVWQTTALGGAYAAVSCKAKVKAWSVDDPPDVMVVDLVKDSAGKYGVSYYPSLSSLPDGFEGNLTYKTVKLVMNRVHRPVGGKWIMGSYDECSAEERGNETQHEVTIAADYWLGVYELTQYQAYRLNDNASVNGQKGARWKSDANGKGEYEIRPLENTCMNFIRGATVYPTAPSTGSILGKLKARTGYAFDLPSEAQWEYAARAGHAPGLWGDGSKMALNGSVNPWTMGSIADTNLDAMACYSFNPAPNGRTMPVGSFKPNDWGFYDMHGNVKEMCIDYWVNDISDKGGAIQVKAGEQVGDDAFVVRGGAYEDTFFNCRPCMHNASQKRNTNHPTVGVRLMAPLTPVD